MKLHAIDSVVEHELSNGASSLGRFTCKDSFNGMELFTCRDNFDGMSGLSDLKDDSWSKIVSAGKTLNQLQAQSNAPTYAISLNDASLALKRMQTIYQAWQYADSQCLICMDKNCDNLNVVNRVSGRACFPANTDDQSYADLIQADYDNFNKAISIVPGAANMSFATDLESSTAPSPNAQAMYNIMTMQTPKQPVDTSEEIPSDTGVLQVTPGVYTSEATPSNIISQEQPSNFDIQAARIPSLSPSEMTQLTSALTSNAAGAVAPANTVKVPPTTAWLTAISNALTSGADAYTKMQVAQIAANAKATGQSLTVPKNFANKFAPSVTRSSSISWGWVAGGVGAVVLGAVALALVLRKK